MKRDAKKQGFTLVEMMVAIIAGAVLALTVGIILVSAYVSWVHNTDSVKMQNDASLAFMVIGREVRESSLSDITISADGKRLDFAANSVRPSPVSVSVSGKKIVSSPSGFALVEDWVDSFSASTSNGLVDVTLRLRGGRRESQTSVSASFVPRN